MATSTEPENRRLEARTYAALLQEARTASSNARCWQCLAAAHIVGQRFLLPHLQTHLLMLALALRTRDGAEARGQLFRLLLVPLGHLTGRLPLGNPGRTTVSAFRPMEVPPDLAELIALARAR